MPRASDAADAGSSRWVGQGFAVRIMEHAWSLPLKLDLCHRETPRDSTLALW